jgi:hypothetical protein
VGWPGVAAHCPRWEPRYRQSRFTTRIRIDPLTTKIASIAQNNSILP